MTRRALPSTRGMCSCHVALLVLVTLFFWLPSYILPCAARVERTYAFATLNEPDNTPAMQGMQAACKSQVNGMLPVPNTVVKDIEVTNFVIHYIETNPNGEGYYPVLGGMMVSTRPDGQPPESFSEAIWCWVYGDEMCGPNNETLIGTHNGKEFVTAEGQYSNWQDGQPGKSHFYHYITISSTSRKWYSCTLSYPVNLLCVVEKWVEDLSEESAEEPSQKSTVDTTAPPKKSLWWIILVVLVVTLLLAIAIVCVVFQCCCGAGAPVEEEYKPEDDEGSSSVRDTRSNRSLVSRGGSMRSMGSRRSSAYSASRCDSQGDMEDYNSYSDDRVSQGRSADSYYY